MPGTAFESDSVSVSGFGGGPGFPQVRLDLVDPVEAILDDRGDVGQAAAGPQATNAPGDRDGDGRDGHRRPNEHRPGPDCVALPGHPGRDLLLAHPSLNTLPVAPSGRWFWLSKIRLTNVSSSIGLNGLVR